LKTNGNGEMRRVPVGHGRAWHDVYAPDRETSGPEYAHRFDGPVGQWFLDVQTRYVLDLVHEAHPHGGKLSVLDLGGGHGQLTDAFLDAGHRVVVHGSDLCCHERLREQGPRIGRIVSGFRSLPFADGSFDLVTAVRVLAHVEDWEKILAEAARVSRELILVDFPVHGPLSVMASALFGAKLRVEGGHVRPYFEYMPGEVEYAFAQWQCARAGLRRQFALPMALHRMLRHPRWSRAMEGVARVLGVTRVTGSPVLFLAKHDVVHAPQSVGAKGVLS